MLDYWLMPLVGFLMDTTLAAASLVFTGVAERFPNIRWVLGHLGGAIHISPSVWTAAMKRSLNAARISSNCPALT